MEVKDCHNVVFDDAIEKGIVILLVSMVLIRKLLERLNPFFENLQNKLWKEYEHILIQEEMTWFSRS